MRGYDSIRINDKISHHSNYKIAVFDTSKTRTRPHKHNKYLEIVYFEDARGTHYIDSKAYRIDAPCISFIEKDQVHYWELEENPKGYVAIFKETFLDDVKDKQLVFLLKSVQKINCLCLHKRSKHINYLFEMLTEPNLNAPVELNELNESLLKALLFNILKDADVGLLSHSNAQAMEFINHLQTNPRNEVAYYAEQLQMSPQNLNSFCKKHFSLTASEVIAIYINKEAKRLLLYSNLDISEIAYKLHFKDASYFIKYFKQHNRLTPLKYRNKNDNYYSFFK
ncbi:helix-turn-helix domain-containing protein [Zunongwangia atlantica]|uniref:AraC family transcriptional regulator n=1 Tax=Zunongwangia atlantica 22II14-10F7 TaxID=1185767 RepID=A0A1Y1T188_9FLAO|nr:helix-turn-helix domain-containing protein [Zunongwangia atlantica]ORL44757.1 AraC family transcriptional regulator [Zunongwangia atlantica 22II14-10F7]